jgi:hypothetical protein
MNRSGQLDVCDTAQIYTHKSSGCDADGQLS